ncbi:MAG TPA: efflux RND transporter periplasmic adaptor subunit [Bacteroidia bacterium]
MKSSLILALSATMFLFACSNSKHESAAATEVHKSEKEHITIDTAQFSPADDDFTVVGEVSFDEDNVVRVYPIVSGSVEKVFVSLGDYVKKGQLLATYLSTDISMYQRDYNVAKSNFEVAQKNLSRAKELYKTNVISQKDLEDAQRELNNAKSDYNEKKQILELYGGSTESLDAIFKVTAPISGYIVERNINEGMQIRTDNGSNSFTISDLKTVWVWASVYESDLSKVSVGDDVEVKTIAYPDKVFKGKIKTVGTMLDPASRVVKVRIDLDNSDFLLKPEMFATVVIKPKSKEMVVSVPTNSVVFENNKFFVMRKKTDNAFEKVSVTIGKNFGSRISIQSGIAPGDIIVDKGSVFINSTINNL